MGTQAGFMFAMGLGYGTFDTVLAVIEGYKEDYEKAIKLTVPTRQPPEQNLAAELFGMEETTEPHFCNPYEPEIALLAKAMEQARPAYDQSHNQRHIDQ